MYFIRITIDEEVTAELEEDEWSVAIGQAQEVGGRKRFYAEVVRRDWKEKSANLH